MSKQTADFYNRFSFFYPLVDILLKAQKRKLFQEINSQAPGKLLEIGVGNGKHLKYYETHQVTGIDTSVSMLAIARKQKINAIELLEMNGEKLLFQDQSLDYVVLSHVIAVVDKPNRLLEEIHRVLKPSGKIFILNHFTPNNWLKYVDLAFMPIAMIFHFKSIFHIRNLAAIKNFKLLKVIELGYLSYFKILIYRKA